ncbi:VG15 protein [Oerskovia jenensis]|uniref:VG15 protein n=1 Tax=Oerskovia jenensis TaxID=162169 RepID=UPI0036DE2AAC
MTAWDDHDVELGKIVQLATRDLLTLYRAAPDLSSRSAAAAYLEEAVSTIVSTYGEQAAWSAVRALEGTREAAGVLDSLPTVRPAAGPSEEQIARSVSWAAKDLDLGLTELVLQKLAKVAGRLVRQPARQTIWNATAKAGTRYARKPEPNACDFCLMLSSRGAEYTKATVTATSGKRGTRPEGLRFHDGCRCLAIESYSDDDLPAEILELRDEWRDVVDPMMSPVEARATWAEHIRTTRANTSERPGTLDRAGVRGIKEHELETARRLVERGYNVRFLAPSTTEGERRADVILNERDVWEMKAPAAATNNAIVQNIRKARGQSGRIVIDTHRSGADRELAESAAGDALRRYDGVTEVWIIGPGYEMRLRKGE